jgi:hypothetical protein
MKQASLLPRNRVLGVVLDFCESGFGSPSSSLVLTSVLAR